MLTVHHLGRSQSERIVWLCEELEVPYALKCYTRDSVTMLSPPDYILSAKVSDLLLAVPKYGHVKVNKILAQCRISPSKTIGGLSQRQRAELVSPFRK